MFRVLNQILVSVGLLVFLSGCNQVARTSVRERSLSSVASNQTVARIHWLGKKRISATTNATGLMQIWNLPESARFEAHILDKISPAPWQLLRGQTNSPYAKTIRPLLDDLVQQESYLEVRQRAGVTNPPGEIVLAIRLKEDRANFWNTNLAIVLESLTSVKPTEHGTRNTQYLWSLKKHHTPNLIELARAGDWTLIGAAEDRNALLDEMLARIQARGVPFAATATNYWLEAGIDLPHLTAALGHPVDLPANFPQFSVTMIGNGNNVQTRGQLNFAQPLSVTFGIWNTPTNFIDSYLSGFTAVRGCQSLLAATLWRELETNTAPNELYLWSIDGAPMQTYFAAPMPDASNNVSRLSDSILRRAEPWFAEHDLARFRRARTFNGLEWIGAPYVSPFLRSTNASGNDLAIGGFVQWVKPSGPAPQNLIQAIESSTNVVYYDWELTGPRIDQLTYLAQLLRAITGRNQLPVDSIEAVWLKSMSQRLAPSVSEIVYGNPRQFLFVRSSHIPFTALELELIVDWIASPAFPALSRQNPVTN